MNNENTLEMKKITKKGNRIDYVYEMNGKWKEFLNEENPMYIEYDFNIEEVPDSIAIVPFICNILPISWVFDLTIKINEIDKQFYECIPEVKKGYINMHKIIPMLGKLEVEKIEENKYEPKNVGALFSGGVDATNTLVQHMKEKPMLLTLWGADVALNDKVGWEKVKNHHIGVANEFGLDYSFIKTNFRNFLNSTNLNNYVFLKGQREWWHDFQHGIGILGHIAPIAYKKCLGTVYIASSSTADVKGFIIASDPTIDNFVKYGNCKVVHDGFEFSRQDKVHNICKFAEENKGKNISLRVCWQSAGGENCCECEKCYRTILEIIAEKKNPKDFGFNLTEEKRKKMMKRMPKLDFVKYDFSHYYSQAQALLIQNYTEEETPKDLIWFRNYKFKKEKPKYKLFIEKMWRKTKNIIKKIIRRK